MKFFIDCEFLEGTQKEKFPISLFRKDTPNTIDLISIGIVSEDGREYYAISKDFNLKEAWNRYDIKSYSGKGGIGENTHEKIYWIRENVLKPIFYDWKGKDINFHEIDFTYKEFKKLLNKYGKTNKQVAEEVKNFIQTGERLNNYYENETILNNFYAYYADYDWVAFCWLFGKMVDLPTGFPMYCRDLKQMLDEKARQLIFGEYGNLEQRTLEQVIEEMKNDSAYPKQTNEHNALADAIWNKKLYKFLQFL
jgi:hypothetical protein